MEMRTFVLRGSVSPEFAKKDPRGKRLNFLGSSMERSLCLLCFFINFYHPLLRPAARDDSRRHGFEQCGSGEETGGVEGWEGSVVGADDERDLGAAEDCGVAAALLH